MCAHYCLSSVPMPLDIFSHLRKCKENTALDLFSNGIHLMIQEFINIRNNINV